MKRNFHFELNKKIETSKMITNVFPLAHYKDIVCARFYNLNVKWLHINY